jgi:integrase
MTKRRVPEDDPRRYLAGCVDYEREQVDVGLPQVDWRQEWAAESGDSRKRKPRRANGEGSIYQRAADDRWFGSIELSSINGKRRYKTVSSKRRDVVVKRLRQLRIDRDSGKLAMVPSTTLENYLTHWINNVRGPNVRPKTFGWYDQAIRLHIVPQIGNQRLNKLTPEHVRDMIAGIQEYSTASAQQAHKTLCAALEDAVNEEVLGRNVAAIVKRPQHNAALRDEFRFEQVNDIIGAAAQLDDQVWAARVVAAFLTGARPGELIGLRWKYVNLNAAEIELAWQLQQLPVTHGCGGTCGKKKAGFCTKPKFKVAPGFTMQPCYRSLAFTVVKTKAGARVVPVLPLMAELLTQLRADTSNNPHDLVFHHRDGRPYSPKEDNTRWNALLAKAGLPPDAVGYQSRHTAATELRRAGVDEALRMSIMGHSSVLAHRGYLHADQSEKRRAAEPLGALTASWQHEVS